jgi:DNA-binding response OmpR family regulator
MDNTRERVAPCSRSILIIEDDDKTATALSNGLVGAGYGVHRTRSAEESLAMLESTHVDLIVMSLMLPDADGLVLCAILRARFAAPSIVLVPPTNKVDQALALESGAIDWLMKPIDGDELLRVVSGVL